MERKIEDWKLDKYGPVEGCEDFVRSRRPHATCVDECIVAYGESQLGSMNHCNEAGTWTMTIKSFLGIQLNTDREEWCTMGDLRKALSATEAKKNRPFCLAYGTGAKRKHG